MNPIRLIVCFTVCLTVAAGIASAQTAKPAPAAAAADPAAKLPAAVLAAFRTAYPNATIRNVAKETETGKVVWEVQSVDNGLARDLVYSLDGTVIEFEEQIDPGTLPAAVSAALKAKYPTATITKAEKLRKGTTLTYEMALKGASHKTVEIAPDGTIIVPAVREKAEKEDAPRKK
jgi:hypothetical protein